MKDNILTRQEEKISQVRPALLIDRNSIDYHTEILTHILSGLSTEGICSAFAAPVDCNIPAITNLAVDPIVHPTYRLPFFGSYNKKKLMNDLIKFKPSVLHCFSRRLGRLTSRLAESLNIPYVLSVDTIKRQHNVITEDCSAVIASSQKIYDGLLNRYKKIKKKIRLVNYATYVEEFSSCFNDRHKTTSMVTVAPLNDLANFEPVLNAVRHLAIDGYEFLFIIIGTGRAEQKVRKLIRTLGLSHIVNIVPYIHPLRTVFTEADIYIHCTPQNRFNPYLLEAMSVGLAVVGCMGGVDDLLLKGETAAIFDINDELNIYATIQRLLDQREKARQLADNAQRHLKANYKVSTMIDNLLDIYKQATKQHHIRQQLAEESSINA